MMVDNFTIYTHEAGAGALAIAMEGPSKADIDFKDNKDGTCDVQYICAEPGASINIHLFNIELVHVHWYL